MQTLPELAADLEAGRTTATALVEECLARIADPEGEGGRAFIKVHAEQARASATAIDALRRAGRAAKPLCRDSGEPQGPARYRWRAHAGGLARARGCRARRRATR